jgi:hypothetical protein
MAYSTPATQSTGDVIGATAWNTLVDDAKWLAEAGAAGKPLCRAYRSSAVSIANNAITAIAWNANQVDNAGSHSTAVNTSRFTAPFTGWYRVMTNVQWAANGSGVRITRVYLNGSGTPDSSEGPANGNGVFDLGQTAVALVYLTLGQYAEVLVYQSSGGALNVQSLSFASFEFVAA